MSEKVANTVWAAIWPKESTQFLSSAGAQNPSPLDTQDFGFHGSGFKGQKINQNCKKVYYINFLISERKVHWE